MFDSMKHVRTNLAKEVSSSISVQSKLHLSFVFNIFLKRVLFLFMKQWRSTKTGLEKQHSFGNIIVSLAGFNIIQEFAPLALWNFPSVKKLTSFTQIPRYLAVFIVLPSGRGQLNPSARVYTLTMRPNLLFRLNDLTSSFLGGSNYNQCTAEDLLPLWLIVFGIVSLFCLVIQLRNLSGLRHMATGDNDSDPGHSSSMHVSGTEAENGDENIQGAKYFNIFMLIFLLGWFGWGNYLVFRIYPPKYTMPSQPPFEYCTQTIYVFAFVLIIAVHSFLILFLLLLMLVACIWQRKSSEYDDINGR